MNLDKYQQAWQADAAKTQVTIDSARLSQEVQRSQGRFRATINWRDLREVAVAALLLPLWFWLVAKLSLPWTWYLTVLALVWVAGFILVDRRRYPQRPSEPGEPLLHYVKESLAQVEHQIWLLRNVFWWYLLPFSISILAFFLQVAWQSSSVWWEFAMSAALLWLFLVVLYAAVYCLNQLAVRVQLEPRRQELLKLIASLEDETTRTDLNVKVDAVLALEALDLDHGWAQNWNLIIPSWREATVITLATLGGACCGLWSPIDELGPTLFQVIVGAVIAFEIALGYAWLRFRKKQNQSASADGQPGPMTSGVNHGKTVQSLRAPALMIMVLTIMLSILAVLALYHFLSDSPRGTSLSDGAGLSTITRLVW